MRGKDDVSDIRIPSFFVSRSTYRTLRSKVARKLLGINDQFLPILFEQGLEIEVTPNEYEDDVPVLDIVLISALSIICPMITLITLYYLWTFAQDHIRQQRSLKKQHLDPKLLKTLPCRIHKTIESKGDPQMCAICLDDFEDQDEIRLLPKCRHEFHRLCIDPWLLTKSPLCPVCKRSILDDDGSESQPLLDNQPHRPPVQEPHSPLSETSVSIPQ
jgi:E3 ubiquitin-protein ligase RNF13